MNQARNPRPHAREWLRQVPIGDPIDRRNAPMLKAMLLLIAIPVPLLWLYRLVGTDLPWREGETLGLVTGLLLAALALLCFGLVRRGHFQAAIRLMLVVVATILLGTYAVQGISAHTYELPLQVLWLFVAGMMIGRRALWWMYAVLAAALLSGGISEARSTGEPVSHLVGDAVIRSMMFLVIAVVVDRTSRSLRESLAEAVSRGQQLEIANRRLEAEILARQRAQEQLLHAQKVETIGHMTSGIAHDFNHLLGLVLGYAQRAKAANDGAEVREAVDGMESAARRASALTHGLLGFSRYDANRVERFDVRTALEEQLPMLRQALGRNISLDVDLPSIPLPVLFDRTQLGLVLLNLTTNAAQAMPGGGRVELKLELAAVDTLRISLRDEGPAIPADVQKRMFEPFFTTKPKGQGTGLGLAIVDKLVTESGGRIQVESTRGAGTRVSIELPLATGGTEAHAPIEGYQANM